jgi:hypothetical protein
MLAAVLLATLGLPLLVAVVAVGLRVAQPVAVWIDGVVGARSAAGLGLVLVPSSRSEPVRAVVPGPLQLVDAGRPSTKLCPDCAETVLASAPACRHCHFHFGAPLRSIRDAG